MIIIGRMQSFIIARQYYIVRKKKHFYVIYQINQVFKLHSNYCYVSEKKMKILNIFTFMYF
jgi:hypothetical protein